jgi:hypothetical protein
MLTSHILVSTVCSGVAKHFQTKLNNWVHLNNFALGLFVVDDAE